MELRVIKRDQYLLGDSWEDRNEEIWKIIGITDSSFGSVFKLSNTEKHLVLSLDSMKSYLKKKVLKSF